MMAAVSSAMNGHEVVLLEKNEKLGKKIYITGKGRCNLTNYCDRDTFLKNCMSNRKFLYSAINGLNPEDTVDFFNRLGLETKVERANRVFPVSEHASDVTGALERAMRDYGVDYRLNTCVLGIETENGCFSAVRTNHGILEGDSCIVATGGISYPSTGSTGDGYVFAGKLGHTVTERYPALVGLVTKERFVSELEGLSLKNIAVKAVSDGKTVFNEQGEMLFTHKGVSGPLILTVSSILCADIAEGKNIKLFIDLKPALDENTLDSRVLKDFSEMTNREFKNSLGKLLPASMIPVIVELSGINPDKRINEVTAAERKQLVTLIKAVELNIAGSGGFNEAVITRGGVSTKEIDPKTMESKLVRGVYFAGEVIDVDALTGGFNLQIAWSTGYAAGISQEWR